MPLGSELRTDLVSCQRRENLWGGLLGKAGRAKLRSMISSHYAGRKALLHTQVRKKSRRKCSWKDLIVLPNVVFWFEVWSAHTDVQETDQSWWSYWQQQLLTQGEACRSNSEAESSPGGQPTTCSFLERWWTAHDGPWHWDSLWVTSRAPEIKWMQMPWHQWSQRQGCQSIGVK